MTSIPKIFGDNVFNEEVMKERLPHETFKSLRSTIDRGEPLNIEIATVVANSMKEWAIEKGATHYTHWFQPMTGMTAEKHDSFINPQSDGKIIMEFSGKELIKGEPDASSFPSGGLRSTFEARGYTTWDPTSFAFVKDDVLCVPTAFCSYSGEALDEKTPLLRSMEVLNTHALRLLNTFGVSCKRIIPTVGAEQEYFLIDKKVYDRRPDLLNCGRTLFGARPAKGQELDDHYFGAIKPRVHEFMKELNDTLWRLGINSKTEHNEVAPAQHELAPVYAITNIAVDQNQLVMEEMKKIANRHDMVCLLAEKPFAGVNGSGKHNNWSISTDTGINLFDPGKKPAENKLFLTVLCSVIKAVDEYAPLLRTSVASAGNDHRLGGNEAPPAIISIFLGDDLLRILTDIENGERPESLTKKYMDIGSKVLPTVKQDTTDRNRTSPFAFTGNKFEFRMVGSSQSISMTNTILNTITASVLDEFATRLEKAECFEDEVNAIILETIRDHKRILFNGNNYSEEWVNESERRGLLNLKSTAEAIGHLATEKNIRLFEKYGVLSETEIHSRSDIKYEGYTKTLHIEALTMIDMANKSIIPSVIEYQDLLSRTASQKLGLGAGISIATETKLLKTTSNLLDSLSNAVSELENSVIRSDDYLDNAEKALYYRREVFVKMANLRAIADELELIVSKDFWKFPTYGDILYSVR